MRVKCWNLKQDKQLSKIKFFPRMIWTEPKQHKDKLLFLRMSELAMGKILPLESVPITDYGILQDDFSHEFPPIQFTSDIFSTATSLGNKTLVLEIIEQDKKKENVFKSIARTQFKLKDALRKA